MTCAICRGESVREFQTASGRDIGRVCNGPLCGMLLWHSHLNEKFGATAEERAELKWKIGQVRRGKHEELERSLVDGVRS